MRTGSLRSLLEAGNAENAAIAAPDRAAMTFRQLRAQLSETAGRLDALGIGEGDRIAFMMPNGPETAVLFLALAAELEATAAPINPAYRCNELELYLSDLKARAVIIDSSMVASDSAPMAAAARLGIPVIRLDAKPERAAGTFRLEALGGAPLERSSNASTGPALFLHTSGTTSRPKLVPLTQRNLCASAINIARTLGLTAGDCTLNVMPLFHIHGLMASVVASLASGGSVYCTPGFNALRFFRWLEASRATWYTAVPSMQQAILARASHNLDVIRKGRLRFIRSCSSTLPLSVWRELESVFSKPVVNAYGMTEASHQISCTIPGDPTCFGTVGKGRATEIAILDDQGNLLPAGTMGEVAIRGEAVTAGYHDNPEANAAAFCNSWLRTGDLGVTDSGGNLTLMGRLKEIINSAGEKISPFEVEEALLAHPGVAAAVAFAVPSAKLGESPGGAVVLKEGVQVTGDQIRAFVADRLAIFKVPRRVFILPEIPKGPTGKPQRIGLAAVLGLDPQD